MIICLICYSMKWNSAVIIVVIVIKIIRVILKINDTSAQNLAYLSEK